MNLQPLTLPIHRVAIVRALPGLGDLLCVIPALRALCTALPQAELTWIGLPQVAALVRRFSHYLQGWLEFPGCPGIPEVPVSAQRVVTTLHQWQQQPFDLVVQLHGSGVAMNAFVALMGAKQLAGFYLPDHYCPDRDRFLPYPAEEPEVWRHLRLLEFLGIPLQGDHLEFPVYGSDRRELAAVFCESNPYVCLHPGASVIERQWSPAEFVHVGNALAAQGLRVVLTGTAVEAKLTGAIASAMRFPAIDLAGKTSLGAIAALLENAQLLICNDTGVSHLAAALQVPSVVLFCQSDPYRWAPLDGDRHRAIVVGDLANRSLLEARFQGRFPVVSPADAASVVVATAMQQLQRGVVYAS